MRANRLSASVSHAKPRKMPASDSRSASRNAAVGAAWPRPGPSKTALSPVASASHWAMDAWLGGARAALDSGRVRKIASGQVTAALGFTAVLNVYAHLEHLQRPTLLRLSCADFRSRMVTSRRIETAITGRF